MSLPKAITVRGAADASNAPKSPEKRITLEEAEAEIKKIVGIPFGKLLDPPIQTDLKTNKGFVGCFLERKIGIPNSSAAIDLADGELKTNKCDLNARPREPVCITLIGGWFDALIGELDFEDSPLWNKIQRILYVPVCKQGEPKDWFYFPPITLDLSHAKHADLRRHLKADYEKIKVQLNTDIKNKGKIQTTNGTFIQVRTKDTNKGEYTPIYSKTHEKQVSDKNYAFYFLTPFGTILQLHSPDYPFPQNNIRSIERLQRRTGS